jgi:hypothetical protein
LSLLELLVSEVLTLLVAAGNLRQACGDVWSAGFVFSIVLSDLGVLFTCFFNGLLSLFVLGPEDILDEVSIHHSFLKLHFFVQFFDLFIFLSLDLLFLNPFNPHIFSILWYIKRHFNRL